MLKNIKIEIKCNNINLISDNKHSYILLNWNGDALKINSREYDSETIINNIRIIDSVVLLYSRRKIYFYQNEIKYIEIEYDIIEVLVVKNTIFVISDLCVYKVDLIKMEINKKYELIDSFENYFFEKNMVIIIDESKNKVKII